MFQAFIYKDSCLRWFGHVQRSVTNAPVKKSELIQVEETKKKRGKPKFISKSIKKLIKKTCQSQKLQRV